MVTKVVDDELDWMPLGGVIAHVEAAQHCYRERAIVLVREAIDGLKVQSRTVSASPYWIESHLPDGKEIFFDMGIEVWRVDVLREWPERSQLQPPPAQTTSNTPPRRRRPRTEGIVQAIRNLWPNGIPVALIAKERDNEIHAWFKEHGVTVPENISRQIQRVLNTHPELRGPESKSEAFERRG